MNYSPQDLEKNIDKLDMDKVYQDAAEQALKELEDEDEMSREELIMLAYCIGIKGAEKIVEAKNKDIK